MSFKAAQNSIAEKEGVSEKAAGAILASSTRNASQKAVDANPNLSKVPGAKKPDKMQKTSRPGAFGHIKGGPGIK